MRIVRNIKSNLLAKVLNIVTLIHYIGHVLSNTRLRSCMHIPMPDNFVSTPATAECALDIPVVLRKMWFCIFSATFGKLNDVTIIQKVTIPARTTKLMLQHTVINNFLVIVTCLQQHLAFAILGLS